MTPLILDAYRQNREESVEIVQDIDKPFDCFLLISPIQEQIKLLLPQVQSYCKEQTTESGRLQSNLRMPRPPRVLKRN